MLQMSEQEQLTKQTHILFSAITDKNKAHIGSRVRTDQLNQWVWNGCPPPHPHCRKTAVNPSMSAEKSPRPWLYKPIFRTLPTPGNHTQRCTWGCVFSNKQHLLYLNQSIHSLCRPQAWLIRRADAGYSLRQMCAVKTLLR